MRDSSTWNLQGRGRRNVTGHSIEAERGRVKRSPACGRRSGSRRPGSRSSSRDAGSVLRPRSRNRLKSFIPRAFPRVERIPSRGAAAESGTGHGSDIGTRPFMPGAGVVACVVAKGAQGVRRNLRARAEMAVDDDFCAGNQAEPSAQLALVEREDLLDGEVDGAGDVALPGVAGRAERAVELLRRANVEQRQLPEPPRQLRERDLRLRHGSELSLTPAVAAGPRKSLLGGRLSLS